MTDAVALRQADADDHPLAAGPLTELVPTCRDLAAMLAHVGRRTEAAEIYDRATCTADRLLTRFRNQPDAEREWLATAIAVTQFAAPADRPAAERSFQRLREFEPVHGQSLNELAWYLVTNSDPCFVDPARAVGLAGKAVAVAPDEGQYWNTLGVARYRAGDWAGAVAALEESRRLLGTEFESFNTFFLALAHGRLGDRDAARLWYDRAVVWMDRHRPKDDELRRFRLEAEAMMGIR